MKLLKDSLSNGPHLVSPQYAQKVIGTHILKDIRKNFASGLFEDPVYVDTLTEPKMLRNIIVIAYCAKLDFSTIFCFKLQPRDGLVCGPYSSGKGSLQKK